MKLKLFHSSPRCLAFSSRLLLYPYGTCLPIRRLSICRRRLQRMVASAAAQTSEVLQLPPNEAA